MPVLLQRQEMPVLPVVLVLPIDRYYRLTVKMKVKVTVNSDSKKQEKKVEGQTAKPQSRFARPWENVDADEVI